MNNIWFNAQFSKSVFTKVCHYFLNPLDKQFPKNRKFHRIFNKNNVKSSYSCNKTQKPSLQTTIKRSSTKVKYQIRKNAALFIKAHPQ